MRNIRTAVAAFAATGLAAFGALAATGGVANAATNLSITGCSIDGSLLTASVEPHCTAPTGTIYNPTSIKVTVNPSFFNVLGALNPPPPAPPILNLATQVSYTLACSVNGHWRFAHEHFQATSSQSNTQWVNLQRAVGSPSPNSCQIRHLGASTLASLTLPEGNRQFTFGVTASGNNGVPGTVWAQYPKNSVGSGSTVCADDTGNGNAGTAIQAFQCENDLADAWLMTTDGQLVHNGDCMTQTGNTVSLEPCQSRPNASTGQVWTFHGTPSSAGWLTNTNGNGCLTAPSHGMIDGAQLSVQNCTGALGQEWKVPPPTHR